MARTEMELVWDPLDQTLLYIEEGKIKLFQRVTIVYTHKYIRFKKCLCIPITNVQKYYVKKQKAVYLEQTDCNFAVPFFKVIFKCTFYGIYRGSIKINLGFPQMFITIFRRK